MHRKQFRNVLLLLTLSGFILSACAPSAPTEAKSGAPEKTASDEKAAAPAVTQAPAEPAPAPASPPQPRKADQPKPARVTPPQVSQAPVPVTPPAPAPVPAPVAPPAPQAAVEPPPPPPAPIPVIDTKQVTVPSGTSVTILMVDSVDSRTSRVGDTFRATIDSPVRINDDVVFQRGADAYVKLTQVASAGDLKGRSELQLALDRVIVGKKWYNLETNVFENQGADQGKKAVRNGALGAAIGAAIGAIAGGGKGAAIGAGAGAGGGVGTTVLMKGEQVRVPSETRLMFTLTQPVDVAINPGAPDSIPRQNAGPQRDRFNTSPQQADPDTRPRVRRRPN